MGGKCLIPALFLAALSMGSQALAAPEAEAKPDADEARIQSLERICAKVACRKSVRTLSLRAAGGKEVEASTERYPYLDDHGSIVIYPGETISVALPGQDEGLGQPTLVAVTDPDGPVALSSAAAGPANLSFQLEEFGKDKPGMLLRIDNQINSALKYDLTMFVAAGDGFRAMHTSACTLLPPQSGLKSFGGFESWPHPIVMLVISNIHGLPKGTPQSCQ